MSAAKSDTKMLWPSYNVFKSPAVGGWGGWGSSGKASLHDREAKKQGNRWVADEQETGIKARTPQS